jgi:hypothetical protein
MGGNGSSLCSKAVDGLRPLGIVDGPPSGCEPSRRSRLLAEDYTVDERAFVPSPPGADRPGAGRLRSGALIALSTLAFLLEAALVLYWLDPAILAHAQHAAHNRFGRYGALLAIMVVNALLAWGAKVELAAPRSRFEHVVNVLALPLFAAFWDTLVLGAFADPDLPNTHIGVLVVIAFCFATLSIGSYIWGLWWELGHPYPPPLAPPPADQAAESSVPDAMRLGRWVRETTSALRRPFAPIWQVVQFGLTLVLTVVQVAVIWMVQAPQVSDSRLFAGVAVNYVSMAIMVTLFFIAYRRAAPSLPHLRHL